MYKIYALIISVLLLTSCKSDFENLQEEFENNKRTYIITAKFIEQVSEAYSFASLEYTNEVFRLVVDGSAKQSIIPLKPTDIPPETVTLLKQQKAFIVKQDQIIYFQINGTKTHGKQITSGLLKTLESKQPEITFVWARNYKTKPINNNWFTYAINGE